MYGILTGAEIRRNIDQGKIEIDPFLPAHINPASVDLTLGEQVRVYEAVTSLWPADLAAYSRGENIYRNEVALDAKDELATRSFRITEAGWLLKPGIGYLMHTRERVRTDHFVPVLDGKSSIGRLFIQVHVTAGYGDPGFDGQYTLEVVSTHPIVVYAGMRICQMRFHTVCGEVTSYQDRPSHYTGPAAQGAVPSQAWRQFHG